MSIVSKWSYGHFRKGLIHDKNVNMVMGKICMDRQISIFMNELLLFHISAEMIFQFLNQFNV